MNKRTLGRIINTAIAGAAVGVCVVVGSPAVVIPVIAIGSTAIVVTSILTLEAGAEKRKREKKVNKNCNI